MKKLVLSLGIVAFNEQEYIETLLEEILMQDYDKKQTELLLINSMSTDATLEIFIKFKLEHLAEYYNILVLDNPNKIQAAGWNVAIKHFSGDALIRLDAHAKIPANFLSANAKTLESGEDVCGGMRPNILDDETPQKRLVNLSDKSMFGASFGKYHQSKGKKYVDTVFHGCYRKEVIQKVGLFNESLGRTEDNDYHYRVRRAGYKICYNPEICSYQFSRPSVSHSVKQKYGNGFWIGRTLFVQPKCISLFHLVPFCFLMAILGCSLLAFFNLGILLTMLIVAYVLVDVLLSVMAIVAENRFYLEYLLLPFMFLVLHLSYGIGTLVGLFSVLLKGVK